MKGKEKGGRRKAGRQGGRQEEGDGGSAKDAAQENGKNRLREWKELGWVSFSPQSHFSLSFRVPLQEREMLSLKILLTRPFFSLPKCSGGAALGVWLIRFLGIICDFVRQVVTGER